MHEESDPKMARQKSAEELKAMYDKEYVERYVRTHSPVRLERLLPYFTLNQGDHVADFACGNGLLMPLVAPAVAQYVGIDTSADFIDRANEKRDALGIPNADFHCSEIDRYCEQNQARFDRAFAMDFSEHVYDQQWLEILVAIRKSLKAGGSLYTHTPNSLFFIEMMKRHSILLKQLPGHIAVRSPAENADLLREAGFKIERLLLIPHYNILRHLHPLSHLPGVGRYFQARILLHAVK